MPPRSLVTLSSTPATGPGRGGRATGRGALGAVAWHTWGALKGTEAGAVAQPSSWVMVPVTLLGRGALTGRGTGSAGMLPWIVFSAPARASVAVFRVLCGTGRATGRPVLQAEGRPGRLGRLGKLGRPGRPGICGALRAVVQLELTAAPVTAQQLAASCSE